MTCVNTCGLTTALGVGIRPGSLSPLTVIVENVVVVVNGLETVSPELRDFCKFG